MATYPWTMVKESAETSEHCGPVQPLEGRRRPALVCAFPRPVAIELPSSGVSIGRGWLAQHGLVDSEVSSAHLRLERQGGSTQVRDAGSRNGTWVNGSRLSPHDLTPLEDGAVLRIGRTLFVYRRELDGALIPGPSLEGLVGPFGLRALVNFVMGLDRNRPGTILVEGETGVGKELVAHAIATALGRAERFAAVNVAGVARSVFESQLFGHVAGSFSGAKTANPGIIVAHDGGTVFLDEIGEIDLELQAKLLRLLENREVLPVGAQRSVRVDVALIAATNRSLDDMVEAGIFRRDLYARLAMARIRIPALRDRAEDILSVAQELARRAGGSLPTERLEVEAVERLLLEPWPNNVRGLDAALAAVRRVDPEPGLRLWSLDEVLGRSEQHKPALTSAVVEAALEAAGGNVTAAAESLGVSRGRLLRFRKRNSGG